MQEKFLDTLLGEDSSENKFLDSLIGSAPKPAPVAEPKPKPSPQHIYGTAAAPTPLLPSIAWSPDISRYLGMRGMLPQPPGGWDELGQPLDEQGKPYGVEEAPKPREPGIYQEDEPSLWERVKGIFRDPQKEAAKATIELTEPKPREPGLWQGNNDLNYIERSIQKLTDVLNVDSELAREKGLTEGAKAEALINLMAVEEGISVSEFRESPEMVEQFAKGFVDMATSGLAPAFRAATGMEEGFYPTSAQGYIGHGLGSFVGLLFGPAKIGGPLVEPITSGIRAYANMPLKTRLLKQGFKEAIHLSPVIGASMIGEAAQEKTFNEAADVILTGLKSGAITGAIFGLGRGLFPIEDRQRAARIITGLVGLKAQRAIEFPDVAPWDRPAHEIVFDTAMDVFFMWRGLPKAEFAKVERIVNESAKLKQRKTEVEKLPDEEVKKVQEGLIKQQEKQLELELAEIQRKIDYGKLIREDLESKGERIKSVKRQPDRELLDVQVDRALSVAFDPARATKEHTSKSGRKYYEIDGKWYNAKGGEVKNKALLKAVEKKVVEPGVVEPSAKRKKVRPEPEAPKGPREIPSKDIIAPEVREKIETREPSKLSTEQSPLRESDKEVTNAIHKMFEERKKAVMEDPEMFTAKTINDVNRWLNGENIPIEKARDNLSKLAKEAEEYRDYFREGEKYPSNFDNWRELVSDAASWARRADRPKFERTEPTDTQLNMMIPMKGVSDLFKDMVKSITGIEKPKYEDIFRNREVFEKTGFWLDRDLNWRYEIDSSKLKYSLPGENRSEFLATGKTYVKLGKAVDYPKMFELFPEMKDYWLILNKDSPADGILIAPNVVEVKRIADKKALRHELQHAVEAKVKTRLLGTNPEYEFKKSYEEFVNSLAPLLSSKEGRDIYVKLKSLSKLPENEAIAEVTKVLEKPRSSKTELIIDRALEHIRAGGVGRYLKDPGEMLARLTELRGEMTAAERAKELPWETLDRMLRAEGFHESVGHTLFSGIPTKPIKDLAKDILKGAKKFEESFDKSRKAKEFKLSGAAKRTYNAIVSATVERRGNLRRELLNELGDDGFEIVHKMYLAAGSPGQAREHFKQTHKEVFSWLGIGEKEDLFKIIDAKRMIDIGQYKIPGRQYRFPEGREPDNAIKFLETLQSRRGYTDKQIADLLRRAEAYGKHIKIVIDDAKAAGLFGEQEAIDLKSHFWRKIRNIDQYDPQVTVTIGNRKFSVRESGVEPLGKGKKERLIEGDAELLALEFMNRMYGRIKHNEANQEWIRVARERPDNPFVWTRFDADGKRIEGNGKKPEGFVKFNVMEGGAEKAKKSAFYVHPELAKELITSGSKDFSYRLAKVIGMGLGAPVVRFFATGAAPVWSTVVNFPIDAATAWGAAKVWRDGKWERLYSSHMPVAALQMGKALTRTAKDAHFRGPKYDMLAEHGGVLTFLAQQARLFTPGERVPSALSRVGDILTYHSESMEIWTRLAIMDTAIMNMAKERGLTYEQAVKNKEIMDRAAFASRDYIDFNQGGWLIKAIDQVLPYTNAGVQAGRVFWRQAKDAPDGFAYRMVQVGTVAALSTMAAWLYNKETQEEIPLQDRARNKTIPLPKSFRFTDLDNTERGLFLKIPLPREVAMFNIFFETLADHWMYSQGLINTEPEYEAVFEAMKAGMPVDPTLLPPAVSALQSYRTGKDLFTGRTTSHDMLKWPHSAAEFTPGETPQAMIDIGEKTGLSPDRLGPALKNMFTESVWSHLVGEGYEKLFEDVPEDVDVDLFFMRLVEVPKLSRIIGVTEPYARTKTKEIDVGQEIRAENMIRGRAAEAFAKFHYWRGSEEAIEQLYELENKVMESDPSAWDGINRRVEFIEKTAHLEDRASWLTLLKKGPEERAAALAVRYNNTDAAGKDRIWVVLGELEGIGGFTTDRFWDYFMDQIE